MDFIYVALGGGLGAMLRYSISLIPFKSLFPILTLITNVLGAVVIGIIVGISDDTHGISDASKLFLKTGLCGGFTTFSTFSLESLNLFEGKRYAMGMIYVVLSCSFCLLGIICGKKIATVFKF